MKVIGAGLGGTGTLQVKAALETLGFGPCYHIAEVAEHPEHTSLWQEVADGRPADWDAIFGGYESSVDFPACIYYAEMMTAYPHAKVLLTVRDPDLSYDRVRETIYKISTMEESPLPASLKRAVKTIVWDRTFGGSFANRAEAIDVFREWIDAVKHRVPARRLLVYDVQEGWEPLCAFLGVDVPSEPFPD